MKKKAIVAGVILCIAAIAAVWFSIPAPIIQNPEAAEVYQVCVVNSEYDREDITDQVDCGRLVQIIEGYTRNRLRHAFAPYQMMVGDVEINGVSGSKSMHILLGSVDVVYESGEKGGYTIHDVEQLERDVREILP